jgi:TRAP-type C4-dicarboxylate transport system substrate-binding protein
MFRNLLVSLAAAAVLLAPSSGFAAADEVFEYNYQSSYGGPHVCNVHQYPQWIEEVAKLSGGRLKINFFLSGALVKNEETTPAIMNGNVDIAGAGPTYSYDLHPYSYAFQLPHITRDAVQATHLYWNAYKTIPEVKAEWDKTMKILAVWGSDRMGLFARGDAVLTPADLAGKRVLIWSGGQVDQVKAWGGIPVQVSPNDTYIALQRGMGDVFFGPLPTGVAYKMMEVSKNITIFPAATIFITIGMNWDAYNDLPDDLKKIIDDTTGEAFSLRSGDLLYEYTNKDIETMKAAGCIFHDLTDAQYQAFKDADREVTMEFWMKELARLGVPDPAAVIQRSYDMAAATPGAGE